MCGVLQVPLTDHMLCCFGGKTIAKTRESASGGYLHTHMPTQNFSKHTHTHTSMRVCVCVCVCVCVFVCVCVCVHTFGAQSVVNGGNFTK